MTNWLQEMSWVQAKEVLSKTNALLIPIGSTEQHGPHLPLGVRDFQPPTPLPGHGL